MKETDQLNELRFSEVAFCASPIFDFGSCPLEKQKGCKFCANYSDGTKWFTTTYMHTFTKA